MSIIKRPIPKVYDYLGNKKSELHSAYSIVEGGQYGLVADLTFKYPYYLLDGNGNVVYDSEGQKIIDPRIYTLQNEYLVEFNNVFYVIKYIDEGRDDDNKKTVSVQCKGKLIDLSYKQIPYINLSPPINLPVDAKRGILEVITYSYQVELGYGYFTGVSGATVTLPTSVGSFDYNGYKIVTLDGAGKYQQKKIISYNTGTRVATLESAFSPVVNTTTLFRIHNSKYDLGFVDPLLINDGTSDIFRALKFEDVTILDALNTIATRFTGNLEFETIFNTTYNEFRTAVKLTLPREYDSYEFRYQKNIKGIRRIIDSTDGCYTRVYPEGRNNLSITEVATSLRTDPSPSGNVIYPEHELGKGDIYNFKYYLAQGYTLDQCKDLFVKDFRFIEDAYTDKDMLFDGAKKVLEELSLPKITYEISGLDLNIVFPTANPIALNVGDTVRVVDNDLGFNFFATITSLVRDWDVPYKPRISLSNIVDNLGDIYYKILKYNESYASRKSLYGKGVSVVISDQATSRNWRYADYIVPTDNTKTATQVIQSAIDEVSDQGGGTVVLTDGGFKFTNLVNLKDNVELIGSGTSTRIYPASNNSYPCFNITGRENVSIRNLFVDYDDSDLLSIKMFSDGIGIYSGSNNINISGIVMETVDNNMIIGIESSNVSIVGNSMISNRSQTFFGSEVIDLKACSNGVVERNSIRGKIDAFPNIINITNQVGISSGEFFVRNNFIYTEVSGQLSSMINSQVANSAYVEIVGNTLISEETIGTGIGTQDTINIKVENNTIYADVNFGGIYLGGEDTGISGGANSKIVCNSNYLNCTSENLESSAVAGIYVGSTIKYAKIQNNTVRRGNVYNTSRTTLKWGIYNSGTSNIISSNDLFESGNTASFQDSGTGTVTLGGNRT